MSSKSSNKNLFLRLFLIASIITFASSTIWDNIFSQTGASHPINLTESFNIDFQLPNEVELDGNFDFNSELKTLTLKLSKNILIQKLDVIKAQLDLEKLELNIDQLLLGCEKFRMGVEEQVNDKIKERVNKVGLSKRSLHMVNLLFKYIGRYEVNNKNNNKSNKNTNNNNKKANEPSSIFDLLKDNKIFDQLEEALGVDIGDNKEKSLKGIEYYDMFEFSISDLLPKNPKSLVNKIEKGKQQALDKLNMEEANTIFNDINLEEINFDMFKFVILTNPKTGEIVKAYKNREMKEEMEFKLHSVEKTKIKCNKEAKKLTLEDLTNGAKYLYNNKDTIGNVLNV